VTLARQVAGAVVRRRDVVVVLDGEGGFEAELDGVAAERGHVGDDVPLVGALDAEPGLAECLDLLPDGGAGDAEIVREFGAADRPFGERVEQRAARVGHGSESWAAGA
jgi:hypothetical protein